MPRAAKITGSTENMRQVGVSKFLGKIFFLLSKRFQKNNKYKEYFMDQVELLVYRHRIQDQNVLNILRHLNNVSDLADGLSQLKHKFHSVVDLAGAPRRNFQKKSTSNETVGQRARAAKFSKTNSIEDDLNEQDGFQHIEKLERLMRLFRADQLYAPVILHFNNVFMNYQRNFFVNLRFMAKMAPFRKIRRVVERRRLQNLRAGFSAVIFFTRPHMKLLLLIYVISKAKQRHLIDSFRRLEAVNKSTGGSLQIQDFAHSHYAGPARRRASVSPHSMLTDQSQTRTESETGKLLKILSHPSSIMSTINYDASKKSKEHNSSLIFNFLREIQDQKHLSGQSVEYGYDLVRGPRHSRSCNKLERGGDESSGDIMGRAGVTADETQRNKIYFTTQEGRSPHTQNFRKSRQDHSDNELTPKVDGWDDGVDLSKRRQSAS